MTNIADLTFIESKEISGKPTTYRFYEDRKDIDSQRIKVLKVQPLSINIEGFTRTFGGQKERVIEQIKERFSNHEAPKGANALLLWDIPYEHWDNNLTYVFSYCHLD